MSEESDNRRLELAELNRRATNGEDVFVTASKLDSSLKKNTAFIKKIKLSINNDQYKTILKDISTLSLEKYLSEIITSVFEGLLKVNKNEDILAAMEIVSALHQRFTTRFSPYLLSNLLNAISNPVRSQGALNDKDKLKDDQLRVSRQKILIKLITEFYIIEVFQTLQDSEKELLNDSYLKKIPKNSSESLILVVLKDLLNFELKLGNSLPIVQTFLKRFNHLIYKSNDLLPEKVLTIIKQILDIYIAACFETMAQLNSRAIKLSDRNKKASIRTGKILEDIVEELDGVTLLVTKFSSHTQYISQVMGVEMPTLNLFEAKVDQDDSTVEVVKNKSLNEDELHGIWENVAEKHFYTKIPTLAELLGENLDVAQSIDGEKVGEFLVKMDNVNDDTLENLVVEFHKLNMRNKASLNRLLRYFTESNNLSKLKYFSKFLKINEEPLADIISQLIETLDSGFRAQIYHSRLSFKNIFFFVEFIKFRMIPTHVIFHKIRNMTMNIAATNNIDILAVFYEQCGRFLLHDSEYGELMRDMVELLRDKSKDSKLNINQKLAVKSMLIVVDPVVTKINKIQENKIIYTPRQKFVIRVLRLDLNPRTESAVLNLIRRTDILTAPDLNSVVLDCFAHPELLNYDNIPNLASILKQSSKISKVILIKTIDTIIEGIKRGLELNDYRLNRVRMSHGKYLAELYNLQLLNFKFLNDLLYKILCFGHPENQPHPYNEVENDLPDNYFRIQLCCLILTNINSPCKEKDSRSDSSSAHKNVSIDIELLETFFVFFQYYIHCKHKPIPVEIQFKIDDLFTKFEGQADVERLPTLRDAVGKLQKVIAEKGINQNSYSDDDDDDEDEDDDDFGDEVIDEDDDDDDDDDLDDDLDEDEGDDDDEEDGDDGEDDDLSDDSDEESELVRNHKENQLEVEQERIRQTEEKKFAEDMDREIQRMVYESYEGNKSLPSIVPRSRSNLVLPLTTQLLAKSDSPLNPNKMAFKLLTKKGKKSDVKQFDLPTDTKFAKISMKEKEDQKQYRERIMNSVLNMD